MWVNKACLCHYDFAAKYYFSLEKSTALQPMCHYLMPLLSATSNIDDRGPMSPLIRGASSRSGGFPNLVQNARCDL